MKFYNREHELKELERVWKLCNKSSHFTVVSGRRRVGKTELVKKFCSNKNSIYFFIGRKNLPLTMEELCSLSKEKIEGFPTITKFDEWLEYLFRNSKSKSVIFFDEFQNFKHIDESVFSDFQKIFDKYKNKTQIHIVVAGSYITLINKIFSDKKEPLFGRATENYTINPMSFKDISNMLLELKIKDIEEQIKWYSIFGGIPKYYVIAEEQGLVGSDIYNALNLLLFGNFAPLKEEAKSILIEEFGNEHPSYFSILESVAIGNSEMTTIANKSGINIKSISKYLGLLVKDFKYLNYEVPITEKTPWKSKKGRYSLKDNFLKFWFRYIYRNRSSYEIGNYSDILTKVKEDFNSFVGKEFENISKEFLIDMNKKHKTPFNFSKIGRWWQRDKEIDIVALNEQTKQILFVECKWKDNIDVEKILKELKEKIKYVDWNKYERKEYFCIFAKSFKNSIKEPNVFLFSIEDF